MPKIKYNPEVEVAEVGFLDKEAHVNHVEVLGIPLVVYPAQRKAELQAFFRISFCTPDFKVEVFKRDIPAAQALISGFLGEKEEYDRFVMDIAEKVLLPTFEKHGTKGMKKMIKEKIIEWEELHGEAKESAKN